MRYIRIYGYAPEGVSAIWYLGRIYLVIDFDPKHYQLEMEAEIELSKCKSFLRKEEKKRGVEAGTYLCKIHEIKIK